jgi:hypothetical protein
MITIQLNSIFSAKTDPRENPVKNPEQKQQRAQQMNFTHLIANKFLHCHWSAN